MILHLMYHNVPRFFYLLQKLLNYNYKKNHVQSGLKNLALKVDCRGLVIFMLYSNENLFKRKEGWDHWI